VVREGWIVDQGPWFVRTWFVVPRKRKHASSDDEIKGADDPSLDFDSNDGKTVHGGLGCDHQK